MDIKKNGENKRYLNDRKKEGEGRGLPKGLEPIGGRGKREGVWGGERASRRSMERKESAGNPKASI